MNQYILNSDFSADSLRWINKLLLVTSESEQELEKLQEEIIKNNDAAFAYFFSKRFNYKLWKMQRVIVDSHNGKYAYLFARYILGSDIKALQKIVLSSKNIKHICNFACFVDGADIKPLESFILKANNNAKYVHMLLKHIKNNNNKVLKYKNIILESGKPRYLFELAKHTTNKNELRKIENLIIKSKSFTYMRLFAGKIKSADIEKIEQVILDTENIEEIKKFAKYVKSSKMKNFFLVL